MPITSLRSWVLRVHRFIVSKPTSVVKGSAWVGSAWCDTMSHMTDLEATARELSVEVEVQFVTVSWVAKHYGVSRLRVHRAIRAKTLVAARVAGGGHNAWILDRRLLPESFPT